MAVDSGSWMLGFAGLCLSLMLARSCVYNLMCHSPYSSHPHSSQWNKEAAEASQIREGFGLYASLASEGLASSNFLGYNGECVTPKCFCKTLALWAGVLKFWQHHAKQTCSRITCAHCETTYSIAQKRIEPAANVMNTTGLASTLLQRQNVL
jgi:hypothetical protein